MKRFGRVLGFSSIIILAMVATSFAQNWGYGPVVVFDQRDGGGNASSFGVGEFRNNQGNFGTLRNDSAYSVTVPNGYRVRFCADEGRNGQGSGRCEEFAEGNHNLQYGGTASYIRVWGPTGSGGWGGGWNGGGQRGVTVYEDRDGTGRSQAFGIGRYMNAGGTLGNLRNDKASSVVVDRGFRVRLCDSEGNFGVGSGNCEEYGEGRFNLRYNDATSYVEVQRAGRWGGWGSGGWDNGGNNNGGWNNGGNNNNGGWNNGGNNNNGGWNNNNNQGVIVYTDSNQSGNQQWFDVGSYRNDRGELSQIGNDSASSVWVATGYRVQLCESEPRGLFGTSGTGRCEEYGPGRYNLRYNDKASFIRVWRSR